MSKLNPNVEQSVPKQLIIRKVAVLTEEFDKLRIDVEVPDLDEPASEVDLSNVQKGGFFLGKRAHNGGTRKPGQKQR